MDNKFKVNIILVIIYLPINIPQLQRLYYYQNMNDPEDMAPSAYVPVGSADPESLGILHLDLWRTAMCEYCTRIQLQVGRAKNKK